MARIRRRDEAPRGEPPAEHSGRLLLRMPPSLHTELARLADGEGVSLNQLITGMLASAARWSGDEKAGSTQPQRTTPWLRTLLIANVVVVALAAVAAIVFIILAWRG
jgi:RNA polymerase sigma-B factor